MKVAYISFAANRHNILFSVNEEDEIKKVGTINRASA